MMKRPGPSLISRGKDSRMCESSERLVLDRGDLPPTSAPPVGVFAKLNAECHPKPLCTVCVGRYASPETSWKLKRLVDNYSVGSIISINANAAHRQCHYSLALEEPIILR